MDFANDTNKVLASTVKKLENGSITRNERRFVSKLLEDLIFFVADVTNNGQDVLDVLITKPNWERQKLMREQNILAQVFGILKAPFKEKAGEGSMLRLEDLGDQLYVPYKYVQRLCYRTAAFAAGLQEEPGGSGARAPEVLAAHQVRTGVGNWTLQGQALCGQLRGPSLRTVRS